MDQLKERFLRPCRKITDIIPIAMVITLAIMMLGGILQNVLQTYGVFDFLGDREKNPAIAFAVDYYFVFLAQWPVVFLAIVIPPANRRMLRDILPNHRGNTLLGILLGLLAGFALNATCIGISYVLGDVGFELGTFDAAALGILFVAVLIQSGAEEIIARQFLYEKLRRRYRSPWIAIFFSAAFFGGLHIFNTGATVIGVSQCCVVGLVLALFIYYFDSLWAAIFFHTGWNFTQSILFGCPNSGLVSAYSLFKLTGASSGPFFDPTFGVEGSVGALALLVALFFILIIYAKVKKLPTQDLWADVADEEPEKPEYKPAHMAS